MGREERVGESGREGARARERREREREREVMPKMSLMCLSRRSWCPSPLRGVQATTTTTTTTTTGLAATTTATSLNTRGRGRETGTTPKGAAEEMEEEEETLAMGGEDWRSFRAQLIQSYKSTEEAPAEEEEEEEEKGKQLKKENTAAASSAATTKNSRLWAHEIGNRPEKGCLIIARPDAFLSTQRYFHEAVIFIVDYSPSKGAVGLILNRPTQFTLKSISFDITSPDDDEEEGTGAGITSDDAGQKSVTIPEFLRDNRVYFGGDVKSASSTLIGIPPFDETILPGAQKVVDGVYCNGKWFELNDDNGPAVALDAPKYKFFAQYAGWAPGQLERELETNEVWIAAACAPELILKQVIQLPKPLWREILELMGSPYYEMSKKQYGESP